LSNIVKHCGALFDQNLLYLDEETSLLMMLEILNKPETAITEVEETKPRNRTIKPRHASLIRETVQDRSNDPIRKQNKRETSVSQLANPNEGEDNRMT
jgi:hypothetical protein